MEIGAKLVKELREMTGAGMMDCKKALVENNGDIDLAVRWLQEQGIAKSAKKSGRIAAEGLTTVKVDGNTAVIVELNAETDFVAKNELFLALVQNVSNVVLANKPANMDEANALVVDGMSVADHVANATATIGEKISFRRFDLVTKEDDQSFGTYVHFDGKSGAVVVLSKQIADLAKNMAMQVASMNPQYVSQKDVPEEIVAQQVSLQTEILNNDEALAQKNEKQKEGIIKGRVSKALQEISLLDQPFFLDPNMKVADALKQHQASVIKFVRYAVGEGIDKKVDNFAEEVAMMSKA